MATESRRRYFRTPRDFGHRGSRPACDHRSIRARRPPAEYWDTPPCFTARRAAVARVRRGAFAMQRPTRHRSSSRAMLVLRGPRNRRTRPSRAREGLDSNAMPPPLSRSVRDLEREGRGRSSHLAHHLRRAPSIRRPTFGRSAVPTRPLHTNQRVDVGCDSRSRQVFPGGLRCGTVRAREASIGWGGEVTLSARPEPEREDPPPGDQDRAREASDAERRDP